MPDQNLAVMSAYVGKTIVSVGKSEDESDGFVLHFTDGTSIEVVAISHQGDGFVCLNVPGN